MLIKKSVKYQYNIFTITFLCLFYDFLFIYLANLWDSAGLLVDLQINIIK